MDDGSDSEHSDKANRDFDYNLWRDGNSDHTSEDDTEFAVSENKTIRKKDKKLQAKIFRQFKKGKTGEEILDILSKKDQVDAIKRNDRVFKKLRHGLAVWDAPNVKITKLKLLDSRYALLFKYELGMQLPLLDNFHGQEKAFHVDSAFSDNHHLDHCRVEAVSPNLMLFLECTAGPGVLSFIFCTWILIV